ncbi:hypothetical protein B0H11DRAFT_1913656 [Mycena galericulata]|nr:hypothetical protein B0H11DRAFT_1913656 [Mycena galericulata]
MQSKVQRGLSEVAGGNVIGTTSDANAYPRASSNGAADVPAHPSRSSDPRQQQHSRTYRADPGPPPFSYTARRQEDTVREIHACKNDTSASDLAPRPALIPPSSTTSDAASAYGNGPALARGGREWDTARVGSVSDAVRKASRGAVTRLKKGRDVVHRYSCLAPDASRASSGAAWKADHSSPKSIRGIADRVESSNNERDGRRGGEGGDVGGDSDEGVSGESEGGKRSRPLVSCTDGTASVHRTSAPAHRVGFN